MSSNQLTLIKALLKEIKETNKMGASPLNVFSELCENLITDPKGVLIVSTGNPGGSVGTDEVLVCPKIAQELSKTQKVCVININPHFEKSERVIKFNSENLQVYLFKGLMMDEAGISAMAQNSDKLSANGRMNLLIQKTIDYLRKEGKNLTILFIDNKENKNDCDNYLPVTVETKRRKDLPISNNSFQNPLLSQWANYTSKLSIQTSSKLSEQDASLALALQLQEEDKLVFEKINRGQIEKEDQGLALALSLSFQQNFQKNGNGNGNGERNRERSNDRSKEHKSKCSRKNKSNCSRKNRSTCNQKNESVAIRTKPGYDSKTKSGCESKKVFQVCKQN